MPVDPVLLKYLSYYLENNKIIQADWICLTDGILVGPVAGSIWFFMVKYFRSKFLQRLAAFLQQFDGFIGLQAAQKITPFNFLKPGFQFYQILFVFFKFCKAEILASYFFVNFGQEIVALFLDFGVFFGAVLPEAFQDLDLAGLIQGLGQERFRAAALVRDVGLHVPDDILSGRAIGQDPQTVIQASCSGGAHLAPDRHARAGGRGG